MPADSSPDKTPVIITIDGPAGTGKSTIAHGLALRLGLDYLDTGAMYRGAALLSLEHDVNPADGPALAIILTETAMRFDWAADPPVLLFGRRDVSERIRDMDVSAIVSIVAAQSEVRAVLVRDQRRIAHEHPRLVSEGRDQGSIVFPDAPVRFYLSADERIRARRRISQLAAAGKCVNEAEVIEDIRARDRIDSSRADAPLIRPDGSIDVDTGDRTAEQIIDAMEHAVRQRLPELARES